MTRTKARARTKSTTPHPLEPVVLDAYRWRTVHDRITLASHMKGVSHLSGKDGAKGDRAYLLVAEDVLGCMMCQGKLVVDTDGWHRLAKGPAGDDADDTVEDAMTVIKCDLCGLIVDPRAVTRLAIQKAGDRDYQPDREFCRACASRVLEVLTGDPDPSLCVESVSQRPLRPR